jgi:glutamate-1-semialdehyde 2,1-aminomutase
VRDREYAAFECSHPKSLALWRRASASMPNGVPMSWMRVLYDLPPVYAAEGQGSRFCDVDGNEYADFNIADMSMFCGYAPEPVVEAVARAVARGSQFMLATEDACWVAEELTRRWSLPMWQFTLSASQANVEAIRGARAAPGRDKVLMFDGKYHGHFDEALVQLKDGRTVPEEPGLPPDVAGRTRIVQFNDADAVRQALEPGDIALVLTEPALTNVVGLLQPEPGFHVQLRELTRQAGTLLAYDETHTQVVGRGGLTKSLSLDPDIVTMGKAIAGGMPIGAYGMTTAVATLLSVADSPADGHPPVATGGTLFGNPVSMAAARAALTHILTEDAYAHTHRLGAQLASAIEDSLRSAGLPWVTHRLGPRTGTSFTPAAPRNALDAAAAADPPLTHTAWAYLANRGVWEAIIGAGPTCSIPATSADVARYAEAFDSFVHEIRE